MRRGSGEGQQEVKAEGERTQRECGFLLSRRTFPLQLQKGSRTKDGDSLIASDCLQVVVTSDEVVCLSRERRCYHEVIFRMTRHPMNYDGEGNKAGCAPQESQVVGDSLLTQAMGEVGLVEGAAQFCEDMLGDQEVELAVQPGDQHLSGRTSCIRKAGGQDIRIQDNAGHATVASPCFSRRISSRASATA